MKTIYFNIIFISLLISGTAFAQRSGTSFYSGGHDSLLIDGADINYVVTDIATCVAKVTRVTGDVQATVLERKRYDSYVCSLTDTATYAVVVKRKVKQGDELVLGDVITTG